MLRKAYPSCHFSMELRYRQIVRGIGIAGILLLLLTTKLQQHGHLVSADPSALQSLFAKPQEIATATHITTYSPNQSIAVTSINNLLAGNKPPVSQLPQQKSALPLQWSLVNASIGQHTFNQAAKQAGLTSNEIQVLQNLLAKQIDFNHFKAQDHLKVLLKHDATLNKRQILAIEITQNQKRLQIFAYQNAHGIEYYQADGRSLKSSFLRYPTHYIGIGSGFSQHRLDPVTGQYHSHPAVDFRAPMGTPIVATGDGRIQFMAWQTGYGKVVKINHAGHITTLYAHMQNFAKNLHTGSSVKAGQVIGYVGMTGYATGPHVHYEFRINGVPYDALRVKLPTAAALTGKAKQAFLQQIQTYRTYLN